MVIVIKGSLAEVAELYKDIPSLVGLFCICKLILNEFL